MELYLVRHGQTQWNADKRIQGSTDIPLNEIGVQMAEDLAKELADTHFDAAFSSPLVRAFTTADIVIRNNISDIEIIKDKRISEYNFGEWEGEVLTKENMKVQEVFNFFFDPEGYKPVNGAETFDQLAERTQDFLDELFASYPVDSRVLIVAHGAMNKSILRQIRHLPLKDIWEGRVQPNCSVLKIVVDEHGEEIVSNE